LGTQMARQPGDIALGYRSRTACYKPGCRSSLLLSFSW
jgi:hypothetical protein